MREWYLSNSIPYCIKIALDLAKEQSLRVGSLKLCTNRIQTVIKACVYPTSLDNNCISRCILVNDYPLKKNDGPFDSEGPA